MARSYVSIGAGGPRIGVVIPLRRIPGMGILWALIAAFIALSVFLQAVTSLDLMWQEAITVTLIAGMFWVATRKP